MISQFNTNSWLEEQANLFKHKAAIITSSGTISFIQLFEKVKERSSQLKEIGIGKNNKIGLILNHSYEFWIDINALWMIEATPVPLNNRLTAQELSYQIEKADIMLVLYSPMDYTKTIAADNFQESSSLHSQNSSLILFTSGSTNKPKAVVHTFNSLLASIKAIDSFANLSSSDVWLASLPLYHIGGFMILVRALLSGAAVVFPNSLMQQDILDAVDMFNPTHISYVSTSMQRVLETERLPNKNLKMLFLGGGPLNNSLCINAFKAGYPIVKVYGSTETCSMVCALQTSEIIVKSNSVGKAIGDAKIIIENGEILVSSSSLFKEYYNDHIATNHNLVHGFYRTNDFGEIDHDGYLYIDSRREDIIITGGENVNASEVEAAIKSITQVKDAFVFGIPDEQWGQRVCALIESANISKDELKLILEKNIAGYKIPKSIFFIEKIPRNEMGKISRQEVLKLLSLDEL